MSKPKVTRKKSQPSTGAPQAARLANVVDPVVSQRALLERVEVPYLPLDRIVLTTRVVAEEGPGAGYAFSVAGEDLAALLHYVQNLGSVRAAVDDGDVSLRLRGLAELIDAHATDESRIDNNAAYFITNTLNDLAARLETSKDPGFFRVGVLAPVADRKVVA
jgi:hypothetical protein